MKNLKILLVVTLLNLGFNVSFAADKTPTQTANVPARQAARMVWLDPKTGKLISKPTAGTTKALKLSESEVNAIKRSDKGLIPITMTDGSTMVDLHGRYQHLSTATIDQTGKAKVHYCGINDNHKHEENGEAQ